MRLVAVLAALALAGCVGEEPEGAATLRGAFTESATQAQMQEFGDELRRFGDAVDVALMESFPVQFAASGLAASKCPDARAFALAQPYVAHAGECQPSR